MSDVQESTITEFVTSYAALREAEVKLQAFMVERYRGPLHQALLNFAQSRHAAGFMARLCSGCKFKADELSPTVLSRLPEGEWRFVITCANRCASHSVQLFVSMDYLAHELGIRHD